MLNIVREAIYIDDHDTLLRIYAHLKALRDLDCFGDPLVFEKLEGYLSKYYFLHAINTDDIDQITKSCREYRGVDLHLKCKDDEDLRKGYYLNEEGYAWEVSFHVGKLDMWYNTYNVHISNLLISSNRLKIKYLMTVKGEGARGIVRKASFRDTYAIEGCEIKFMVCDVTTLDSGPGLRRLRKNTIDYLIYRYNLNMEYPE